MRVLAMVIVFVGALVLGVDVASADRVLVDIEVRGSHGIHASDVVGTALLVVGVTMLLRA